MPMGHNWKFSRLFYFTNTFLIQFHGHFKDNFIEKNNNLGQFFIVITLGRILQAMGHQFDMSTLKD